MTYPFNTFWVFIQAFYFTHFIKGFIFNMYLKIISSSPAAHVDTHERVICTFKVNYDNSSQFEVFPKTAAMLAVVADAQMTMSSPYNRQLTPGQIALMYTVNNSGSSTNPWGAPMLLGSSTEFIPFCRI